MGVMGAWEFEIRPEFYVQTGAMTANPYGVPEAEVKRIVETEPVEVVAQIVFGKYVEHSGLVFSGELIDSMIDRSLPVVRSGQYLDEAAYGQAVEQFRQKRHWGQRFHIGVDVARQTDYTVISVLDTIRMPARLVYWKRLNKLPWDSIYAEIGRARFMFGPNILLDSTGPGGDVILDALDSRLYCSKHHRVPLVDSPQCLDGKGKPLPCKSSEYVSLSCVEGFTFTGGSKQRLVEHLRTCLSVGYTPNQQEREDFGWIRTPPIPELQEEMAFYSWDDKKLMTDCLFSLALASWSALEEPVRPALVGSVYGS